MYLKKSCFGLIYENNVTRVCKIKKPINQLIITNADTAKIWLIKPIAII